MASFLKPYSGTVHGGGPTKTVSGFVLGATGSPGPGSREDR